MKKMIVIISCVCLVPMIDAMHRLTTPGRKNSASQSQDDSSCETPGRNSPQSKRSDFSEKPISMTSSSGIAKIKVNSVQELRAQVQKTNQLNQSGETSSSQK